jgi:PAS domain S-box-containing protein
MKGSEIDRKIAQSRRRLKELRDRAGEERVGPGSLLDEASRELERTLEALSATLEELATAHQRLTEMEHAAERHARRTISFFLAAPTASLITDGRGLIREANRPAEEKFGLDASRLLGRPLLSLVARPDHETFLQALATLDGGHGGLGELELRFACEPPFDALVGAVSDRQNGDSEILWMLRDVTEMKERDVFRDQIERHLAPVVWLYQLDPLKTLHVSPAYESVWGRPVSELYDDPRNWLAQVHPEDRHRVEKAFERMLRGEPFEAEYRILLPDGRTRCILDRGTPFEDIRGRRTRAAGLAEDVTEKKEAEAALREAENRRVAAVLAAERAEARERRSLARDLHDALSQSLALARTKLAGLREAVSDPEARDRLREVESIIGEADERTRTLTFRLSPPILHDLGFAEASEWLAEDLERQFGLRTRVTSDELPKPFPVAMREALFRSLRELLINVARHAGTDEAQVSLKRRGDTLDILVEDSGAGFDGGIDNAGGFGLASVRERLEALGGRLEIRSEPGRGTRARMVVPLPRNA